MKKFFISFVLPLLLLTISLQTKAQGIPFIRNYSAETYGAHNRNFDVITDDNGIVYVANFEGLLYYDKAEFRMMRTPGFIRITSLYRDSQGTIWTGGYNYFGKVVISENGEPRLQSVAQKGALHGEVNDIWESNKQLFFSMSDSLLYTIQGETVHQVKDKKTERREVADEGIRQILEIDGGIEVVVTDDDGLIIRNGDKNELYITEDNGLCSDNVNSVAYDGHGMLWGATDNGLFSMALPSAYSHFSTSEGLRGEVLCIRKFYGDIFVGTVSGLFRQDGMKFVQIRDINHACWQMTELNGQLVAATSKGVYFVDQYETVTKYSDNSALSVLAREDCFYTGEIDGVYRNDLKFGRNKICELENVVRILCDKDETIWLQSLDGQIQNRRLAQLKFSKLEGKGNEMKASTLVMGSDGEVIVVSALDTSPFSYPAFSYTDTKQIVWLTDNRGRNLHAWQRGRSLTELESLLLPLGKENIRAMLHNDDILWLGGEKGLLVVDCAHKDTYAKKDAQLRLRSIVLGGDSILWGGLGEMPGSFSSLSSHDRHLVFNYALDYVSMIGTTLYRFRLDNDRWDVWDDDNQAEFNNLNYGPHTLEIQAKDATGKETPVLAIQFFIQPPFYLHPVMLVVYVLAIILLIYLGMRYRLRKLEKAKQQLERTVEERTAEVVKQKDEIQEKSENLEKALNELGQAQKELVRQEKMATVGKLTQGLIDRILNPLNYINNFSKLSEGLVKDVEENIEDEKDNMDKENYEDTIDVLGMLRGNLQKVSEHGQNTTRTLKAMEEMLKDRSGGIVPMSLTALLHQDMNMLKNYFSKDIAQYHIQIRFTCPDNEIRINGNAEQLSKTFMSILGNSVYALVKKAQRESYEPEILFAVEEKDEKVLITIRDNGIGIEDTIIDKIFDPFFTTKPTGEASGVGLYLSHEIIQNHGGDISVTSEKGNFTEFIINIPTIKS